jgi:hypothetical protein
MTSAPYRIIILTGLLLAGTAVAGADPVTPVYSRTYIDCTTFQNQHTNSDGKERWTIGLTGPAGAAAPCDNYQQEYYERPTTATYQVNSTTEPPLGDPLPSGTTFAAAEYYQNLDIVLAKAGVDNQYMYVLIDLVGTDHLTEVDKNPGTSAYDGDFEGLKYQYEFLLSTQPDGAGGFWLSHKGEGTAPGTTYDTYDRNTGQYDATTNSQAFPTAPDVGGSGGANGLSITKQDNAAAAEGNGFDLLVIEKGILKSTGQEVLFSRLNPLDPSIIEFALDYGALGFTRTQIEQIIAGSLGYLDFRAIKGGPEDPQNYLWNDEYTKNEAGSPYQCGALPSQQLAGCEASKSIFNTQGLGNIYELDTLRGEGITVPEPSSMVLLGMGVASFLISRRRRRL